MVEKYNNDIDEIIQNMKLSTQLFPETPKKPQIEKWINDEFSLIKDEWTKLQQMSDENKQLQVAMENTLSSFQNMSTGLFPRKNKERTDKAYTEILKPLFVERFSEMKLQIKKLSYLAIINNRNITIVGENGAGKSTFASYEKSASSENIVVIPAQKHLYVDTRTNNSHNNLTINIDEVQEAMNFDITSLVKKNNDVFTYNQQNEQLFSKLLAGIVNDHVKEIVENGTPRNGQTKFNTLKKTWDLIFPEIFLSVNTSKRTLEVEKNNSKYLINNLSDGEKVVLYYLLQIIFVPEHSFVIIDEPETYLNSNISNRLWDTLESIRTDVNFIYISHNISFISSRKDTSLIWIKKFSYPDNWDLVELEKVEEHLPKELVSRLVGTKRPVIFIEGTTSSPDYALFYGMFGTNADIIPVEGHSNVINYTSVYNQSGVFANGHAYGIIDRDLMGPERIDSLKRKDIYTLPFNEIEMMFFDEEIMQKYLLSQDYSSDEVKDKINRFKKEFFDKVKKEATRISEQKAKKVLDTFLAEERVENFRGKMPNEMVSEIESRLHNLNLENLIDTFNNNLRETIHQKDYDQLLVLSPLKKAISIGLADIYLDSAYMEKMSNKFKRNSEFSDVLRVKYFADLQEKIISTK